MILIGALAFGICVFFIVGFATGRAPQIRFTSRKARPEVSSRQIWLTQAGLELSPTQYYLGLAGLGGVVFAIVTAATTIPAIALAPTLGAVAIPHAFFSQRRTKNMAKVQQVWPDALYEVVASIEANASLHGALVALSNRGPEPLRVAFERFPAMASTLGVVPALEVIRERMADPTSDRVIEVLILAHERGGGIVTEILRDLAHATTEDLQLKEEIESSQLEQKINGRAVFVLPWLILFVLVSSSNDFRAFYKSGAGLLVVFAGAVLSVIGIVLLGLLSRDKAEPRVFGGSAVSDTIEVEA